MLTDRVTDPSYLFHMTEVVDLIGAEVFDGKNLPAIVSGLPHVGKPARGERALDCTGRYQGQRWRYEVRRWEDSVDTASLSQCSERAIVNF